MKPEHELVFHQSLKANQFIIEGIAAGYQKSRRLELCRSRVSDGTIPAVKKTEYFDNSF